MLLVVVLVVDFVRYSSVSDVIETCFLVADSIPSVLTLALVAFEDFAFVFHVVFVLGTLAFI